MFWSKPFPSVSSKTFPNDVFDIAGVGGGGVNLLLKLESSSTNVHIGDEDLPRTFYKLFYLRFCVSSDREKQLYSKDYTRNSTDTFK